MQDHVYTRKELDGMSKEELRDLLSKLLYAKGHMGFRDYQDRQKLFKGISEGFFKDTILGTSRFDMRRNRMMTSEEVARKLRDTEKLKKLLG